MVNMKFSEIVQIIYIHAQCEKIVMTSYFPNATSIILLVIFVNFGALYSASGLHYKNYWCLSVS